MDLNPKGIMLNINPAPVARSSRGKTGRNTKRKLAELRRKHERFVRQMERQAERLMTKEVNR